MIRCSKWSTFRCSKWSLILPDWHWFSHKSNWHLSPHGRWWRATCLWTANVSVETGLHHSCSEESWKIDGWTSWTPKIRCLKALRKSPKRFSRFGKSRYWGGMADREFQPVPGSELYRKIHDWPERQAWSRPNRPISTCDLVHMFFFNLFRLFWGGELQPNYPIRMLWPASDRLGRYYQAANPSMPIVAGTCCCKNHLSVAFGVHLAKSWIAHAQPDTH